MLCLTSTFAMAQEEAVVKVSGGKIGAPTALFDEQLASFKFGTYPKDMRLEVLLVQLHEGKTDTTCIYDGMLSSKERKRIDIAAVRKEGKLLVMCADYGSNIAMFPLKTSSQLAFFPLPAPKNETGRSIAIGFFTEEADADNSLKKILPINQQKESQRQQLMNELKDGKTECFLLTYRLSES